jgi:amino acid transporter
MELSTTGTWPAIQPTVGSPAGQNVGARKGLKTGALGLVSSVVVGVASTAPAYSLAATLGFVVAAIGLQAPIVTLLAFVPMLFVAIGYNELNKADPDCGTTFTWATRAFGPVTGWANGWAIVAADVLVMASLAQIAGQYVFLLFNSHSRIGHDSTSPWVLLVGIAWIVAMSWICYRGIELSANIQKALLAVELTMLGLLAVVALVKVGNGTAPVGHLVPSVSWFNPFDTSSLNSFAYGLTLMLFIYWGWDTAVSVNEETADARRTPGRAAVISTVVLLAIYVVVVLAVESYAGLGTHGIGLKNTGNQNDVLSVLGTSVFGGSGIGSFLARLLVLMVLSSAAASTLTTILPTARTTLSMAAYRSIPKAFARVHPRYLTPTVSTVVMGAVSIVLYVIMNYLSAGSVIVDSVTAIGIFIAFYYGFTGFACTWYYRSTLRQSARNLWLRGILPSLGGTILFAIMGYSLYEDWSPGGEASATHWNMSFPPHWRIGGVFVIVALSVAVGVVAFAVCFVRLRPFFRGETLNMQTPTLVPENPGVPEIAGMPEIAGVPPMPVPADRGEPPAS